jgi:hypothetical protein
MQRRSNVQWVSSGCRDRLLWTCEQLWTVPSKCLKRDTFWQNEMPNRISQLGHRLSQLNLFMVFLSSPVNAVIVPLIRPELKCPCSGCSSPSGVLALLHPEHGSNSITSLKSDGKLHHQLCRSVTVNRCHVMLNRLRATLKMSCTFSNCYVMIDVVTFLGYICNLILPFKFPTHQDFHSDKTRQLCSCKEHTMGIVTLQYIALRGIARFVQEGTTIKY